jgi:hypothetical protein
MGAAADATGPHKALSVECQVTGPADVQATVPKDRTQF